jgi:hypothetical protein
LPYNDILPFNYNKNPVFQVNKEKYLLKTQHYYNLIRKRPIMWKRYYWLKRVIKQKKIKRFYLPKRIFNKWVRDKITAKIFNKYPGSRISIKNNYSSLVITKNLYLNKNKLNIKKFSLTNYDRYFKYFKIKQNISTISWIIFLIFEIIILTVSIRLQIAPSLPFSKKIFWYKLFRLNSQWAPESALVVPIDLIYLPRYLVNILSAPTLELSLIRTKMYNSSQLSTKNIRLSFSTKIWFNDAFLRSPTTFATICITTPNIIFLIKPFQSITMSQYSAAHLIEFNTRHRKLANIYLVIKTNLFFYIPFIKHFYNKTSSIRNW